MTFENELNNLDEAIIVALGSNMPGPYASSQALLEQALLALDEGGLRVVKRSRWWRSAAWPDPTDPPYLNGVAIIATDLGPAETLARLHRIEANFGRRRAEPNAPRTLDLDLIAHGRRIEAEPLLPHPRAHERRFVMGPLAEIAPNWVHPVLGGTAAELLASVTVGLDVGLFSGQDQTMNEKASDVEEEALDWDGPHDQSWADAWIERNKDALKVLIAEAEEDIAAGRVHTMEEVEAELGRRRAERRRNG